MADSSLAALQAAFTAHLRDPARHAAPNDVPAARLALYRELLLGNVDEFLARAFPVLRGCLSDERWRALVDAYFAAHRARTPLAPRMAEEFLAWLATLDHAMLDPPYVMELARYEWLEADVLLDPRELDEVALDADADPLTDAVVLNPILHLGRYAHAVHRITPGAPPSAPAATPVWLVVYRRRDDRAAFMELNDVAARLLQLLGDPQGHCGEQALAMIAAELKHPRPAAVIDSGRALLADFLARDIVLGARHSTRR
ncbi:MAG: putative DNA-binding domain-containing protein [Gammaproteobacteria bacterium]|nr:putative DNA-binding domain-containing protein [Gammaproteobacteria bacterium]